MKKSAKEIQQRENEIVKLINRKKSVTIDELCRYFSISPSTARNEVNKLASQNLIIRTLGGASRTHPVSSPHTHPNTDGRNNITHYREKLAIAQKAAEFVKPNDVLGICGGTTTYLFAKEIASIDNLTVVTNSLWVASELCANNTIEVRMSSGTLRHDKGALIGPQAESFFKNYRFDKVFVGADAVSLDFGITSNDPSISFTERNIIKQSKETYIMIDYSKFEVPTNVEFIAAFEDIDAFIIDSNINESIVKVIESTQTKVYKADV